MYVFEQETAAARNFKCFCGTDEAGRGPLAGPVYAAAVYLGDKQIDGLNDSKKISPKKRDALYDIICSETECAVESASVGEIEQTNILEASQAAMRRAVDKLCSSVNLDVVLVDGNIARGFSIPAITVVGGDAKCASIAAASILAKVSRDREMERLDSIYPGYGLAKHKGYPTKDHYSALSNLGPSPIHRTSFLKKFYKAQTPVEVSRGRTGEDIAFEFLLSNGHTAVTRNFRSRIGEIDIVTTYEGFVVFTEVKLRKNLSFAEASEFVDYNKVYKIRRTAEFWLIQNPTTLQPRFDVIEIYADPRGNDSPRINHIIGAF